MVGNEIEVDGLTQVKNRSKPTSLFRMTLYLLRSSVTLRHTRSSHVALFVVAYRDRNICDWSPRIARHFWSAADQHFIMAR